MLRMQRCTVFSIFLAQQYVLPTNISNDQIIIESFVFGSGLFNIKPQLFPGTTQPLKICRNLQKYEIAWMQRIVARKPFVSQGSACEYTLNHIEPHWME